MRRRLLQGLGIGALGVGVVAGLFFWLFEQRSVEVQVDASREAQRNPYLALELLMERMGHPVVRVEGIGHLDPLPPPSALLVAPASRRTLTRERQQALLDWVEAGGHLLVVTYTLWDEDDRRPDWLLDRFGLRQYMHEPEQEEDAEAAGDAGADPAAGADAVAEASGWDGWDETRVYWPGAGEPLEVRFDPDWYWVEGFGDAELYAGGDWGIHMILLRHGAGRVAALTDDFFLRNAYLDDADHAELAVRMARLAGPGAPVWIVISERWPGLWSRALRHAAPALLALAVFLAAWIWRAARRFGPLLPPPELARRRWMEHLEAVGSFHWRADRGRTLLAATRASVQRAVERRHPSTGRLATPERSRALARLTGLDAHQVSLALDEHFVPAGEAAFVTAVARLERIRARL